METRVNVNGCITSLEKAVVPVTDRGFLYGDSVYEVFWWHRGILVQEREHLDRLRESGRRLYMDLGATDESLLEAVDKTVDAAGVGPEEDAYVRLMVTRGSGPLGLGVHADVPSRVVVMVAPAKRPTPAEWERGLAVVVAERVRNAQQALDPGAKTGNYLNNVLALHEARLAGADDAVMLGTDGQVTEATTSNVYAVRGGQVLTPPVDAGILKGTTRTRILEICRANEIGVSEVPLHTGDLEGADELFVSSSVRGILAVTSLGGVAIGGGSPGPLTRRLLDFFEAAADREARERHGESRRVRDVPSKGHDTP